MLTAARNQVRRWVQVSSLGVYSARDHFGTDESTPPDIEGLDGYTRTKAEAEVLLNRHIQQHALPVVTLRPGFIYGPGDRHVLPRIIKKFESGTMRMIGDGQKQLNNTSVDNLVDAIVLGLQHPDAVGETFNIRDRRLVTRQEYISTIAEYLDLPYPKTVPAPIARMLVVFVEGWAKLRGATEAPFLTRASIKFMDQNLDYSIDKATRVLGYTPRDDFQSVMHRALEWARSHGQISREP
jgi:nucleoside-diphosphate-sugar epimerase